MDDDEDERPIIGTTSPINTEVIGMEDQSRQDRPNVLNQRLVVFFEILLLSTIVSVLCVFIISWHSGDTLLEVFSFRKEDVKKPVFVAVLCFLSIVMLVCSFDLIRRIYMLVKNKRKSGGPNSLDNKDQGHSRNCKCQNVLPDFELRSCLEILDFRSLTETGLLASKGSITEKRFHGRTADMNTDYTEYCNRFVNGIPFGVEEFGPSHHSIRLTVVMGGPEGTGKTSLFNRIISGYSASNPEACIGINCALKTFTVTGPNMFNEDIGLSIEMQIWDLSGNYTRNENLPQFPDHVVFLVVCDVTKPELLNSAGWWIDKIGSRSRNPHVALFLNKIDEVEDDTSCEEIENHPELDGIDVYKVSAKTGQSVRLSFLQAICKAVLVEARRIAE